MMFNSSQEITLKYYRKNASTVDVALKYTLMVCLQKEPNMLI